MANVDEMKVGNVLWLKVRYQIDIVSTVSHPMLIAKIEDKYIEVIALDKTEGKMHQLFYPYNLYINSSNPNERVINQDSYAQLNTKITIEKHECLLKSMKTTDILSKNKLTEVLEAYDEYQKNNKLCEERIVHMSIEELISYNEELKETVEA